MNLYYYSLPKLPPMFNIDKETLEDVRQQYQELQQQFCDQYLDGTISYRSFYIKARNICFKKYIIDQMKQLETQSKHILYLTRPLKRQFKQTFFSNLKLVLQYYKNICEMTALQKSIIKTQYSHYRKIRRWRQKHVNKPDSSKQEENQKHD